MKKILLKLLMCSLFLFSLSCSKEEFATQTQSEDKVANASETYQLHSCSRFTEEKPPVDILFVVDNSSSTYTPNFEQIKSELKNLIAQVSEDFDYHIVIAPLLAPSNENNLTSFQVVASSHNGLSGTLNLVQPEQVQFFSSVSGGNVEHGFKRTRNIINANISNNVFRHNAHTFAVMISNGDDNDLLPGGNGNTSTIPAHDDEEEFKKFSGRHPNPTLNSIQFRFISLVAASNCGTGFKVGTRYRNMSQLLYSYAGGNDSPSQDRYDICSGNYASVFAGINNSIKKVIIGHVYDHWALSNNPNAQIEPSTITVNKIKPDGTVISIPEDSLNGFTYVGSKTNQPIRISPTVGEYSDGLFVKLNGSAKVSFPDCILASTTSPTEYFGYIALSRKPVESSIILKINGQTISPSATNGWQYYGYSPNLNVKVQHQGKSNQPPLYKTGYMIQLNGSAVYTNGDQISISYKPDSI